MSASPETAILDLAGKMADRAREARRAAASQTAEARSDALRAAARSVEQHAADILAANAADLDAARKAGRPDSFIDRLALDADD